MAMNQKPYGPKEGGEAGGQLNLNFFQDLANPNGESVEDRQRRVEEQSHLPERTPVFAHNDAQDQADAKAKADADAKAKADADAKAKADAAAQATLAAQHAAEKQTKDSQAALLQQFHDVASGKVRSQAEMDFESQFRNAMAQSHGASMNVRGQLAAGQQQRQSNLETNMRSSAAEYLPVLQAQARQQAAGQEVALAGQLRQGDLAAQDLSTWQALAQQGLTDTSAMNSASNAYQALVNQYQGMMGSAGNQMGLNVGTNQLTGQVVGMGTGTLGSLYGYYQKMGGANSGNWSENPSIPNTIAAPNSADAGWGVNTTGGQWGGLYP